jgi:PleD family two-component response regulator
VEAADELEARKVVKRIQDSMHELKITEHEIGITFSCGIEYLKDYREDNSINSLIKTIDERLYQAKGAGKDCLI